MASLIFIINVGKFSDTVHNIKIDYIVYLNNGRKERSHVHDFVGPEKREKKFAKEILGTDDHF